MIVGLCSTYLEGPLAGQAVATLLEACELVLVLEGPAGDPLEHDVPPTELGDVDPDRVLVRQNRWRTDARKRQAHLEWAKQEHARRAPDGPLWGVIVDGDEVLMNGRFLPDWLRRLDYHEELDEQAKYIGRPMRLVELDGSVVWVRGRLLRLDRVREYKVSTSVFVTYDGTVYKGGGNVPDSYADWELPRQEYIRDGRMLVMPPLPTEPYLVHRSLLRHPSRSGLRMHEQERAELVKAGLPVV